MDNSRQLPLGLKFEEQQETDETELSETRPRMLKPTPQCLIPLELGRVSSSVQTDDAEREIALPARWEELRIEAQDREVFSVVVEKLREVPAYRHLSKLITLSQNEGYAWVVFGKTGSGKSAFFQTLEYKYKGRVQTSIIDSTAINLTSSSGVSRYLEETIRDHRSKHGDLAPLVIVLEGREQTMSTEERSAVTQALRNVLRAPGPGKNVIFVLPVINLNQGNLFLEEAKETGVATPKEGLYTFSGPLPETHTDIVSELFFVLNEKNIEEVGISCAELQNLVSNQLTIGQYIRTIRDELSERNEAYRSLISGYGYRPLTVIICFVSPEPAYQTQRTIKGMTYGSHGRVSPGELLTATKGNSARRWYDKRQVLAKILQTLDVRVVEFSPDILHKLLYVYGWPNAGYSGRKRVPAAVVQVEDRLKERDIPYKRPQSIRQNVRSQLSASNLFRLIAGEEMRRLRRTRSSHLADADVSPRELRRRVKEHANRAVVELTCELASNYQYELHTMVAKALTEALEYRSDYYPRLANWRGVFPEPWLTVLEDLGQEPRRVLRPDLAVETRSRLYLLEFHWRNKLMTDADMASYVLNKINNTYLQLPHVKALEEM